MPSREAHAPAPRLAQNELRLVSVDGRKVLTVPPTVDGFEGPVVDRGGDRLRLVTPTPAVALWLREIVPTLRPRPLGPRGRSFGFGDRLGLATPGHVRALRAVDGPPAAVLAQQSARELERTGRSFDGVLAAATWGAIETGWTSGYGADADHLRTEAEVVRAVRAGFTMVTLDPSSHVDVSAARAVGSDLESSVRDVPWEALEDDWKTMRRRHAGRAAAAGGDVELARVAATFGKALAHLCVLSRALGGVASEPLDVEISVDETNVSTTPFAHAFLAVELTRLHVRFTALAPRFPGVWEKGVDLAGHLENVASAVKAHAGIAAEHGPYKLSVHSGSDKFSLYPLLAPEPVGAWHVKTSGTSYLEALRVVAATDPPLFREVLALARARLDEDRRDYAIGADAGVPTSPDIADAELPGLLDRPGARQCLHVTFGSVVSDAELGPALRDALTTSSEQYADALARHFGRHLALLGGQA